MELKLIETEKLNSNQTGLITRELYEIGDYKVEVNTYESAGNRIIYANKRNDVEYLPSIHGLNDYTKGGNGALYGFEISTISYGKTMMVDDIREMIKAYEQAVEVVEILTEKFINT